jgi:ATP-dependent protease Clp ATPase subunit
LISSPSDYPRAYICDECIAVCNSIIEDDKPATSPSPHQASPQASEVQDNREDLHSMLDDVPEADIPTMRKILLALIRRS